MYRSNYNSNHSGEDGHYYISISDLMTSLLFIFILILAYVMLSFVQKQEQLNSEVTKLEKNIEYRNKLLTDLKIKLLKQNIYLEIDKENGNMRLKSDLLFQSGSAEISPEGKRQIGEIAKILVQKMKDEKYLKAIDTIFIEGHTDNIPLKVSNVCRSSWSNKELSAQRAINTFTEMDNKTNNKILALKNIKNKSLFSYSGYADARPLCIKNSEDCRNKNRRIEFYFTVNTPDIKKIKETEIAQ